MSVAPERAVKGRSINSGVAKIEAEPKSESEAERIAIGIRIAVGVWRGVRKWGNGCHWPFSELSLQIDRCGRLPIELVFELIHGTLLGLQFAFKLRNCFLLRFQECVHTASSCVTFIIGTFPRYLGSFCSSCKYRKHERDGSCQDCSLQGRVSEGLQIHGALLLTGTDYHEHVALNREPRDEKNSLSPGMLDAQV
jgi:hypothetical protein